MPSKTSKRSPKPLSQWKVAQNCSEHELALIASALARELKGGDRVLLEGHLGAGKSTFARYLLLGLGVRQPPEGSPTFAIAHQYETPSLNVVHLDLYRLKSESEIEEAGIPQYFWDRSTIVIAEWISLWPIFESLVAKESSEFRNWKVRLDFAEKDSECRNLVIESR
jgi:tRNA threonylcarbamoyladenosine biosynthesis protein TsaE